MGRSRRSRRTHLPRGGCYKEDERHFGILKPHVAELCNGSTYDSDSYCLGSSPSSAAKKKPRNGAFLRFGYRTITCDNKNFLANFLPGLRPFFSVKRKLFSPFQHPSSPSHLQGEYRCASWSPDRCGQGSAGLREHPRQCDIGWRHSCAESNAESKWSRRYRSQCSDRYEATPFELSASVAKT